MKRLGNYHTTTSFHNGSRKAGTGIIEDDYSEESGGTCRRKWRGGVKFPNDGIDPKRLNGEVIIVQEKRRTENEPNQNEKESKNENRNYQDQG